MGRPLSFPAGWTNTTYYILEQGIGSRLRPNYSGTGNTLNANNPIVRRMIVDCPPVLGGDDARRTGFPLRPSRRSLRAGPVGPGGPEIRRLLWDIEVGAAARLAGTEAHRPKRGMRPACTRWGPLGRQLEGMERPRFRDDVRSFFRGAGRLDQRLLSTA